MRWPAGTERIHQVLFG